MELELGLKITHTRDDQTSTTDLHVTRDPSGPVFVSKEIDTMFILQGHLKGFMIQQTSQTLLYSNFVM